MVCLLEAGCILELAGQETPEEGIEHERDGTATYCCTNVGPNKMWSLQRSCGLRGTKERKHVYYMSKGQSKKNALLKWG